MRKTLPLLVAVLFPAAAIPANAAILLIDPSSSSGSPTHPSGPSQPYGVSAGSTWNSSSTGTSWGTGGIIKYSDGSTATGVTITADALSTVVGPPDTYQYNFSTSAVSNSGNAGITGVFSTNPTNNALYGPTVTGVAGGNRGGVAMKITGLASGTYDIFIVAAYVGGTSGTWPGGGSAAQQNIWAFSGASGTTTIDAGTYGSANELLENSRTDIWEAGNNYAKISVTLDGTNPDLFIIAEGFLNDSKRGWLNSIQIVPEPSAAALSALGLLALGARRRR